MADVPPTLPAMTDEGSASGLSIGDHDPELAKVLDRGLDEFKRL